MKNNPVFQVLVVSNPTLLAAANGVGDLAVGQLGIFDAKTHLSLDDQAALPSKFYFAAGLPNQQGTLGDIRKSAGEYIEKALLHNVYSQNYVAPVSQVISLDLTNFTPKYATDYVLRFAFMSGQSMTINGYQNPVKTFVVTTPSNGTGTFTLATFTDLVIAAINNDPELLLVAAEGSPNVINITVGAEDKEYVINGINKRYDFLRQFKVTCGLSEGFETDGTYTVTSTGPVYEEGSGYDIQQLEYVAGGWIGNPGIYRDSNLNGILAAPIMTYAIAGTNYWVIRFKYGRQYTSGGTLSYDSTLETVIAIPQTSDYFTLINELITMVNTYLPNGGSTVAITSTTTTTTTTTGN